MSTTNDPYNQAVSATTESFVSSLIVNVAVAAAELAAWILIRRQFRAIYEPRSYLPPKPKRVPRLETGLIRVLWELVQSDPELVLRKNGVGQSIRPFFSLCMSGVDMRVLTRRRADAYVFIRFIRMMLKIFIPTWLLTWIVLLPIDAVGTQVEGKTGLDQLTFGNVDTRHQSRLWAHLVMAYVFTFYMYFIIQREMRHWVSIRQRYLISPDHSRLAQANTVLITGIDAQYLDEERLAQLFSHLPGGVKRIWLNRDLKGMVGFHEERVKAAAKLEEAQVQLIKTARQLKLEAQKQAEKAKQQRHATSSTLTHEAKNTTDIATPGNPSPSAQLLVQLGAADHHASSELVKADRLVPRSARPTHRLPPRWFPLALPFTGTRIDTIDHARSTIVTSSHALETARAQLAADIAKPGTEGETYPPLNSAFIYFHQQIAAHMAAQILLHDQPYKMTGGGGSGGGGGYTDVAPEDVVWSNLNVGPYERKARLVASYAVTLGLVILWTFPTTFIGGLSNLSGLCDQYDLGPFCTNNAVVKGVVQGVAPPILLAVLNLLLPVILRALARYEGIPRKTGIELSLMTRYAIFLIFNSFLIVTLSSGLIRAIPIIANNPSSIATTLAQEMPRASSFFLTFVLTQAAGSIGNLLQPVTLVIYLIKLILQGGTPRSVYNKKYSMQTPQWGQTFPSMTLLAVIAISYAIISPIVSGLSVAAFFLAYVVYKYLYTWVIDQPPSSDTGGSFFPKAITHVFVGMYIQEVALCALFFLARNADGKASAIPQGALMVVLCVATLAVHYIIIDSYGPLRRALPLSLAYLSHGMPKEQGHERSILEGPEADFDPRRAVLQPQSQLAGDHTDHPDVTNDDEDDGGAFDRYSDTSEDRQHINKPIPADKAKQLEMADLSQWRTADSIPDQPFNPAYHHIVQSQSAEEREAQQAREDAPSGDAAGTITPRDAESSMRPVQAVDFGGAEASVPEDKAQLAANKESAGERNREDYDVFAFAHPASKEPQRVIWLPEDELGLAAAEIKDNMSIGIMSTSKDAVLNNKGKVEIFGPPPDHFEGTDE
ncbi:hypothetical protein QFC21_006425 [Naganishia friedmannii]|uniref:Uncharacterized protein n=1 Tax=Naganishia friedmannii TaxID=89922 RepID=A0ACC2V2Q4_9TREE|nr:hypothetical protein QFC21_006425 [Naganishia friedmannii]